MAMGDCLSELTERACRDMDGAFKLKEIAIVAIFFTGAAGVTTPVLFTRFSQGVNIHGTVLSLVKCFAAGVILSTGFVHVLPEAFRALQSDCLPEHPWHDFPFAGAVAMVGALLTLMVDILAAKHGETGPYLPVKSSEAEEAAKSRDVKVGRVVIRPLSCCGGGGGGGGGGGDHQEDIIGGGDGFEGMKLVGLQSESVEEGEEFVRQRQKLVSKVLEIGILFHSVIIGVTLGMSQNRCTIGPLVGALIFHQFFEGLGLGVCVALAEFGTKMTAITCVMFSVTTPLGIVAGMAVNYVSGYDENNPKALIMEGIFGSASSGILVYMALVDLIAAEFLNTKKMKSNPRLMAIAYFLLLVGAGSMSLLAWWA